MYNKIFFYECMVLRRTGGEHWRSEQYALLVFIFPPFSMIGRALQKVQLQGYKALIIVLIGQQAL
jgi:hypothetical protein